MSKLRMGMVGGGAGAFIGAVHRMAAALDGKIDLVAGAFSADPEKSRQSGSELLLDSGRVYDSFAQMADAEAALPEEKRIDFVSIVTPNVLHFDVAKKFLESGFHVVCDKPLAFSLTQAKELKEVVQRTGLIFGLTHNYTGYPRVKEARAFVRSGKLGKVIKIVVEYPQGYATPWLDRDGDETMNWRMDPKVAGNANCVGDIGTHAENLARYITDLQIEELSAELTSFIPGHRLDDDANMLVRYQGGAKGILYASQVSAGDENNLNIRVYGEKASLQWFQEHPNELIMRFADQPAQIHRRGNTYNGPQCQKYTRIPAGHPEAFIEAFANIYLAVAEAIQERLAGKSVDASKCDFPNIDDGVIGMAFIDAAVRSSENNAAWTRPLVG